MASSPNLVVQNRPVIHYDGTRIKDVPPSLLSRFTFDLPVYRTVRDEDSGTNILSRVMFDDERGAFIPSDSRIVMASEGHAADLQISEVTKSDIATILDDKTFNDEKEASSTHHKVTYYVMTKFAVVWLIKWYDAESTVVPVLVPCVTSFYATKPSANGFIAFRKASPYSIHHLSGGIMDAAAPFTTTIAPGEIIQHVSRLSAKPKNKSIGAEEEWRQTLSLSSRRDLTKLVKQLVKIRPGTAAVAATTTTAAVEPKSKFVTTPLDDRGATVHTTKPMDTLTPELKASSSKFITSVFGWFKSSDDEVLSAEEEGDEGIEQDHNEAE